MAALGTVISPPEERLYIVGLCDFASILIPSGIKQCVPAGWCAVLPGRMGQKA